MLLFAADGQAMDHLDWASKASGRPADLGAIDRYHGWLEHKRVAETTRLVDAFSSLPPEDKDEPARLLGETLAAAASNLDVSIHGFLFFSGDSTTKETLDWATLCGQSISRLPLPEPIRMLAMEYLANLLPDTETGARRRLWASAGAANVSCLSPKCFSEMEEQRSPICSLVCRLSRDVRLLGLSADAQEVRIHFSQARAAARTLQDHPHLNVRDHRLLATIRRLRGESLDDVISKAERATLAAVFRRDGPRGRLESMLRALIAEQLGLDRVESWSDWWGRVEQWLSAEACVRAEIDTLSRRVKRETRKLMGAFAAEPESAKQRAARRVRQRIEELNRQFDPEESEIPTDDDSIEVLLDVLHESVPTLARSGSLESVRSFAQRRELARELATHRVAVFESEKPRLKRSAHAELSIWEELYRDTQPTTHQRAQLRLLWRSMSAYLEERGRRAPTTRSTETDLFSLARSVIDQLQTEAELDAFNHWLGEIRKVFERPAPDRLATDSRSFSRSEPTIVGIGLQEMGAGSSDRSDDEGREGGEAGRASASPAKKRTISGSLWKALPWNWWSRKPTSTSERASGESSTN